MTKKNKRLILILLAVVILMTLVPLFTLKGAEFGGSDDAGSGMVEQIEGKEYTPWVRPVMEQWIGGELPSEMESLLFCVQTGIGVGILFFALGRMYERKKLGKDQQDL